MRRLPSTRTVSGWLAQLSSSHVARLVRLNSEVVGEALNAAGRARLTIDVDGSVVSTGQTVEGAKRGFNPHHRKVPSYYPITAYEAQSGQILRVENRPGNVHDGKASLEFLEALVDQIHETVGRRLRLEFRMDGAFFRRDVLALLDSVGAEYAIKVPFYPWLHLKSAVAQAQEWIRIDDTVSYCETRTRVAPWNQLRRIVLYRKRVAYESRKNFQLDLFDPDDGHYEYSAITTNKSLNGLNLWHFLNGRGTHEKGVRRAAQRLRFQLCPEPESRCQRRLADPQRARFQPHPVLSGRGTSGTPITESQTENSEPLRNHPHATIQAPRPSRCSASPCWSNHSRPRHFTRRSTRLPESRSDAPSSLVYSRIGVNGVSLRFRESLTLLKRPPFSVVLVCPS